MHFKQLTIVSDTAIYKHNGSYYAFGPVVREIEFIEELFDQITWIGYERIDKLNDLSMQKIKSKKIKVVFLKRIGGKNIFSFFRILFQYPVMFFVIFNNIYKADIVHTRAPSHPALIAILISFFLKNKKWWNKYAGSWSKTNASLSYRFQKYILSKATFSVVTINGKWSNQPQHCYSFENPCLTTNDVNNGEEMVANKEFAKPFIFTFIGRVENAKGINEIGEAFKLLPMDSVKKLNIVGDGSNIDFYKTQLSYLGDKVVFHGSISSNAVHDILRETHFFLLPSKSEGFPKVISEAICYGAIPVVSDVGSIPQYINNENGLLWNINSNQEYSDVIIKATNISPEKLKKMSTNANLLSNKFTFENYKLAIIKNLKKS